MLRYLLISRIGSGNGYFKKMLEKKGLKIAKSYTTRKKRDEKDVFHYFNADYIPDEDRLFETNHNGNVYFYTAEELENAEIIPIDPENIKNICNFYPDDAFRFISIMASNEDRIKHAVANADDKILAEEQFIEMCKEENDAFCEFEDNASTDSMDIPNLYAGHFISNDFTENSDMVADIWDEKIKGVFISHKNISKILDDLIKKDTFTYNPENDTFELIMVSKETGEDVSVTLSRSRFTEQILLDPNGMYHFMTAWLVEERN